MKKLCNYAYLFLCLFPVLSNASSGERLTLRDSTIYPILKKNSAMDCRVENKPSFGFVLSRGSGSEVKINSVTNGVVESDATMLVAQKIREDVNGVFVQYKKPYAGGDESYGNYLEFSILRKRSPQNKYLFPGVVAQTSIIYTKKENGKIEEELFAEFLINLECKMI